MPHSNPYRLKKRQVEEEDVNIRVQGGGGFIRVQLSAASLVFDL
jgi:hypothetical protein